MTENSMFLESTLTDDNALVIRSHHKTRIEALLYSSHQGMHIQQILAAFPGFTPDDLKNLIHELMLDFQAYNSALEIIENEPNHFCFQVKHAVMTNPELNRFTKGVDFTSSEIQLLAYIGYNQPINQQDLIDVLGTKIKKSIKQLEAVKMIENCDNKSVTFHIGEESVTMEVTGYVTTKKFADYFNIPNDLDAIKALFQESMGEN